MTPIRVVTVVSSDDRWALYVDGRYLRESTNLRWSHGLATALEDLTAGGAAIVVRRRRMCEDWLEALDGGDLPLSLDEVQS